jgi:CRISPR/Cas system CSM-associated protein Csm2 small subunit
MRTFFFAMIALSVIACGAPSGGGNPEALATEIKEQYLNAQKAFSTATVDTRKWDKRVKDLKKWEEAPQAALAYIDTLNAYSERMQEHVADIREVYDQSRDGNWENRSAEDLQADLERMKKLINQVGETQKKGHEFYLNSLDEFPPGTY